MRSVAARVSTVRFARARAGEQHALGACVRAHAKIRAVAHRAQIADRGRTARAVLLCDLIGTEPFLLRAVEIVIERVAAFLRGFDECVGQHVAATQVLHAQRPVRTVQLAAAARIAFGALEIGQHVLPGPTLVADHARPFVVVARVAADVAHRIDRARTAEHAPARPPQAAVVQRRLGLGRVIPVDAFLADQLGEAGGHVDERVPVARAGLEQQHTPVRIGAQAVGQHAAGRSGADDDAVVLHAEIHVPRVRPTSARLKAGARADAPSQRSTRRARITGLSRSIP